MSVSLGSRHYLIQIEHGYECTSEEIEFDAPGSEIAISWLDAIPNKRRAVIFEDGKQIADLSYFEGFWQVAASG